MLGNSKVAIEACEVAKSYMVGITPTKCHLLRLGHSTSTQSLITQRTIRPSISRLKRSDFGLRKSKMSVANSFPYIKIPNPSSSSYSSSSSSTSTSYRLRFSSSAKPCALTIRSSQAEGPIRRPVAPSPSPPLKPVPPSPPTAVPPPKPAQAAVGSKNVITLEFQRQKAKELQEYFKQKKLEESNQGPFFGFIPKNEISNGRWAMFGFAVGMLTEYATGSDFVDQVKILLSNFGILDLE